MNPVIIYSFLNMNGNAVSHEETKILATCSQYYAKKNTGYRTVLYTDEIGANLLKNIPYDEIILFDKNILDKLPKNVWSIGKILAMSMEKRPFIHIDFDFFIFSKKSFKKARKKPFFVYHNEPWTAYFGKKETFYVQGIKIILDVINEYLNINTSQKFISVNFSIFGSFIEKNIPIINNCARKMIDCVIKYKDFLDSSDLLDKFKKPFGSINGVMIPVIIEQVLLFSLIKSKLKKYHRFIKITHPSYSYEAGLKVGLIHLWDAKKATNIIERLNNLYNFITDLHNKKV